MYWHSDNFAVNVLLGDILILLSGIENLIVESMGISKFQSCHICEEYVGETARIMKTEQEKVRIYEVSRELGKCWGFWLRYEIEAYREVQQVGKEYEVEVTEISRNTMNWNGIFNCTHV